MSNCPDCKDGFYYPLVGPPEPCSTCKGTNYHLGHPQGTPGPCPDCNDWAADVISEDSSQDVSFDRQCKTAFDGIENKDRPRIYYSNEKFICRTIEFHSQHSRERRISLMMSNIKHFLNDEARIIGNVTKFYVNIDDTKFYEIWDEATISWKTGVHLKIASVWRAE